MSTNRAFQPGSTDDVEAFVADEEDDDDEETDGENWLKRRSPEPEEIVIEDEPQEVVIERDEQPQEEAQEAAATECLCLRLRNNP